MMDENVTESSFWFEQLIVIQLIVLVTINQLIDYPLS